MIGLVLGRQWLLKNEPDLATRILLMAGGAMLAVQIAALAYVYRRGWLAMTITGLAAMVTFNVVWYSCGAVLGDIDDVRQIISALNELRIPRDARIYWADKRPDARLDFYFNRPTYYLTEPSQIVARIVDRTGGEDDLQEMAIDNAKAVMHASTPAYLLVSRKRFNLMEQYAGLSGTVLDSVPLDPKKPEKDLLIVANRAPTP